MRPAIYTSQFRDIAWGIKDDLLQGSDVCVTPTTKTPGFACSDGYGNQNNQMQAYMLLEFYARKRT